jgi:hypothetical protein
MRRAIHPNCPDFASPRISWITRVFSTNGFSKSAGFGIDARKHASPRIDSNRGSARSCSKSMLPVSRTRLSVA